MPLEGWRHLLGLRSTSLLGQHLVQKASKNHLVHMRLIVS